MSPLPVITGPWANWDDTLNGQAVYFSVEEYPDSKKATEELRRLLVEVDEDDLTPGRPKRERVKVCMSGCEEWCYEKGHQTETDCWVYRPRLRKERSVGGPPIIMRCPNCRLLCLTSARTKRCYVHGAYSSTVGKVIHCPGSRQIAINPDGTRHTKIVPLPARV